MPIEISKPTDLGERIGIGAATRDGSDHITLWNVGSPRQPVEFEHGYPTGHVKWREFERDHYWTLLKVSKGAFAKVFRGRVAVMSGGRLVAHPGTFVELYGDDDDPAVVYASDCEVTIKGAARATLTRCRTHIESRNRVEIIIVEPPDVDPVRRTTVSVFVGLAPEIRREWDGKEAVEVPGRLADA